MLTLARKLKQQIRIGHNITVTVIKIQHGQVWLGISAPPEVPILRQELWKQSQQAHAPPN